MTNRLQPKLLNNQNGFVLVAALSCLVVLSLIGIAAMNSANTERQIAHNINIAERTFYGADGATEVGIEMIEWNISCPLGFVGRGLNSAEPDTFYRIRGVEVADAAFAFDEDITMLPWKPEIDDLCTGPDNDDCLDAAKPITDADSPRPPNDGARSMRLSSEFGIAAADNPRPPLPNVPHTNLAIFGLSSLGEGGSIQMAAGYEGKGKGAAGGGSVINYEVWAQTFGINNAEAVIRLGWQHLVGSEGECRPY